jgi:hypothetical protein
MFTHTAQTDFGAHPASLSNGYRRFQPREYDGCTTHLQLVELELGKKNLELYLHCPIRLHVRIF